MPFGIINSLSALVNNKFKKDTKTKIVDDKVETMFSIPYIGMSSVINGRTIHGILKSNYCVDVIYFLTLGLCFLLLRLGTTSHPLIIAVECRIQVSMSV